MEIENNKAINDFKSILQKAIRVENVGIRFNAWVVYYAKGKVYKEILSVLLPFGGYDPVDLSFDEEGELIKIDTFHTTFKSKYCKFSFNSILNQLIIEDTSPKMGGDYKVTVEEIYAGRCS